MKFVVSSTELLSRLQSVSRVISSKNTLPILDNFLFQIQDGTLTITAPDLETTMRTRLNLDNVDGEGTIAIDAKRLTDILKEFPEQPLIFEINNDTMGVDILSDNGKFSVMGQSGMEYPEMQRLNEDNTTSISMQGNTLLKGIMKTLFATADDELRPVMNGISITAAPEGATFAASDAHKLVRYRNANIECQSNASFILDKKPANMLKNILAKENDQIKLQFDEKNAHFILSDYEMICRLVDGQYPNYETIIPTNNPNKLTITRMDLVNTLKRVSVFASQSSNLIKLELRNSQVTVSAQDIDFSTSAEETITCDYNGTPMAIGFKAPFLIDLLGSITSADVLLKLADPARAGLLLPAENEENEDVLMLLMPMLLND